MVALASDDRLRGLAHSEPGHKGPTYSVASGLGATSWVTIRRLSLGCQYVRGKELRSSAF